MSAQEKLFAFVQYAGELFGYDDFEDLASDMLTVEHVEDASLPFYSADVLREETNEVYRFCLIQNPAALDDALPAYVEIFREFEAECEDEYDGAILLLKPDDEEQEDFWFIYRTERGEIGIFHSDLSLDDADEEDEEDESGEAENLTDGHR
jgi:hypothetical protein